MWRTGRSFVCVAVLIVGGVAHVGAQSDDDAAERQTVERFVGVLEKNPRRGTAFDKVYGYHVERGSLNELVRQYHAQSKERTGAEAATSWIIIGLIESQRGHDAEAIGAFTEAEKLDPHNAMAAYYLGRTFAATEQTGPAVEAFERALERPLSQADQLETYQALGRTYQRTNQREKALAVWTRLEQQFPNDVRVQEQIATTLLEEGDLVAALSRFEALAKSGRDKSRQLSFEVEAADIKSQLGQSTEAIQDFERILKQLNPDHWLYRDIRRRIEGIFQKSNNLAGLIDYYEKWLVQNPSDLEVISRLARQLIAANRGTDAQEWLNKGLKLAPSNKELRLTLINQLLLRAHYADAIAQYAELDRIDPNNPDTLKAWGRTMLKDTSRDSAQRQQSAMKIWRRMLAIRPNDAQMTAQVADLFRQAGIVEEALSLYRQAIEQAPEAAQYREYLGDYLKSEKRTPEAIAAWREMATGKRETAPNLARLAEILARVGELPEAIKANAAACQLDPKDFSLQIKQVDLLERASRHKEALDQLRLVEKLAATDDEQETVWNREFLIRRELKQLVERIGEGRKELSSAAGLETRHAAVRWHWLARAYESENQAPSALTAIRRAIELDPQSIRILATSARLHEGQQRLNAAVEQYQRLTQIDRRFRSEYLQKIATLEERLGHPKQALQAGRDLLAAVPGNPEISGFFAELCFRTGEHDEGLQTLRKAVRANPAELGIRMRLASVLMERKQISEAIDFLWQAFERAQSLDDRLLVVQKLTEAHASIRELNRLFIRLERERHDAERHRELTFCLAKAYEVAGIPKTAQFKLETLLTEGTRDTQLLAQLRFLCEHQQNFAGAADYQRQIWQISAAREDRSLLIRLLMKAGRTDDAVAILIEESGPQVLSADLLVLIDGLALGGKAAEASGRLKLMRAQFPQNWELLYREAALLARSNRTASIERFEELLQMNLHEDDPSLLGPSTRQTGTSLRLPAVDRLNDIQAIHLSIQTALTTAQASASGRATIRVQSVSSPLGLRSGNSRVQSIWQPHDFGEARVAALSWLVQNNAVTAVENKVFCKGYPGLETPTRRQHYIDRLAIFNSLRRAPNQIDTAREMMKAFPDDVEAKVLYLIAINNRAKQEGQQNDPNNRTRNGLTDGELDEMLSAYREVAKLPGLRPLNVELLWGVNRELSLVNRFEVAQELAAAAIEKATTEVEVAYLMVQIVQQRRGQPLIPLSVVLDRLIAIRSGGSASATQPSHSIVTMILSRDNFSEILANSMEPIDRPDELLPIWTRYTQLQDQSGIPTASSRQVNAMPLPRAQLRSTTAVPSGMLFGGMQNVVPPLEGSVVDAGEYRILQLIRNAFAREERSADLMKTLQTEADSPDLGASGRLFARSAIAVVQSLDGKQADSAETLWAIAQEYPQRQDLRIGIARQFADLDQPERALEILDTAESNASPESVRRILALRFSTAMKDDVRGKVEATLLANQLISQSDLNELVAYLFRYGMYDIAEKALTNNAASYQLPFHLQRQLMIARVKLDKLEGAATVANDMLKQLEQPQSRPQEQVDVMALRRDCYETLQKCGKLDVMIESAEKELTKAPRSEYVIDRLIAYYEAMDNKERLLQLQYRKLELNADKSESRFAMAIRLIESDKLDKALEQFHLLIVRDPRYLAIGCREALFRYDNRKELTTIARLVAQLDWGAQDRQLTELPSVVHQLCQRPATQSIGEELFQKTWNDHPERRCQLLEQFKASKWWDREDVRNQFGSAIIPQSSITSATEEWKAFGLVLGNDETTSDLSTVLNRMIEVTAKQQKLDQLATEVKQAIQQQPEWETGPVILALIDLNRGRVEAGRDSLQKLLPKLQPHLVRRPTIAWEIAQELSRLPQSLDVGIKYFEIAIRHSERVDWMVGASPGRALTEAFVKHGRKEDARLLLIRNLPAGLRPDANLDSRPQPADIAQVLSICRRLSHLGYPMETISICDRTLVRIEKLRVGGYDPRVELQTELTTALAGLKPESFPRCITELQPLTMLLFVQGTDRDRSLKCRWDSLLAEVAKSAELTKQTQSTLDQLTVSNEAALAPLIMSTQLAFEIGDDQRVADNVARLIQRLKTNATNLESGDEKELAKPVDYADQIAFWLVARRCLQEPKLRPSAITLGQRALEAARWNNQLTTREAIRAEWTRMAQEANDKTMIERLENDTD